MTKLRTTGWISGRQEGSIIPYGSASIAIFRSHEATFAIHIALTCDSLRNLVGSMITNSAAPCAVCSTNYKRSHSYSVFAMSKRAFRPCWLPRPADNTRIRCRISMLGIVCEVIGNFWVFQADFSGKRGGFTFISDIYERGRRGKKSPSDIGCSCVIDCNLRLTIFCKKHQGRKCKDNCGNLVIQ